MVMTNKETLKIRLSEAEEAYHKLMISAQEVSVNVGGFGSVTYNQANRKELEIYISSLKEQISSAAGTSYYKRRVIKVCF